MKSIELGMVVSIEHKPKKKQFFCQISFLFCLSLLDFLFFYTVSLSLPKGGADQIELEPSSGYRCPSSTDLLSSSQLVVSLFWWYVSSGKLSFAWWLFHAFPSVFLFGWWEIGESVVQFCDFLTYCADMEFRFYDVWSFRCWEILQ